jgi:hypothetical protein
VILSPFITTIVIAWFKSPFPSAFWQTSCNLVPVYHVPTLGHSHPFRPSFFANHFFADHFYIFGQILTQFVRQLSRQLSGQFAGNFCAIFSREFWASLATPNLCDKPPSLTACLFHHFWALINYRGLRICQNICSDLRSNYFANLNIYGRRNSENSTWAQKWVFGHTFAQEILPTFVFNFGEASAHLK